MQRLIVAVIVLAALAYTVWKFMPARWRQKLAARLGLSARVADAGACHGCDGCARGSACGSDAAKPASELDRHA